MAFRILHCLAPAPVGGLETVVRLLARGQRARGHDVTVLAVVDSAAHPFVRTLTDDGIPVVSLQSSARAYRREQQDVAALITERRTQVVHAHGYRPDILDLPVAQRLGVPTVSTLHGFTGGGWKMRVYERLQLRALRRASAVIGVSRGVCERARTHGIRADRIHLIPNAYASTANHTLTRAAAFAELGLQEGPAHIAWVGRLSPEKGPDVLIDALPRVREQLGERLPGRELIVSFLGDGPDLETVRARAERLGVASMVRFHGRVREAARLLGAFDACVSSSRTEGTPLNLLEAMAAGVPIVATRVGGVPDMLSDDDAHLVDSGDLTGLAHAILSVLADPADARRRARYAEERLARDFGVDAWLDQHDALYARIQ